jgi:hypothetical protein
LERDECGSSIKRTLLGYQADISLISDARPLCSFVSFVVKGFAFPIPRDVGDGRGPQIGPFLSGWGGMTAIPAIS